MKRAVFKALSFIFLTCALAVGALILSPIIVGQQNTVPSSQSNSQSADRGEILLTVTVTNKRQHFVKGLTRDDFTILDNKAPQAITSFDNEDAPHSIGLMFDTSGSMEDVDLNALAGTALNEFTGWSNDSNEYFVIAFNNRQQLLLDWTPAKSAFALKLPSVQVKGMTALYDAIYSGIEKVKTGNNAKRVLLMISDGQDSVSKQTYKNVREMLRRSDIILYAIVPPSPNDENPLGLEARSVMDELTSVTGGRAFFPKSKDKVREIYEAIAIELRQQYRIGFKPSVTNGKSVWRSIKVKVTPPPVAGPEVKDLKVRSREGYYTNN